MYNILLKNHFEKISVTCNNDLEECTRGQWISERWREEKSVRLSSSSFKEILCRRLSSSANLVKRLLYGSRLTTKAMRYGLANEEIARKSYSSKYSIDVKDCGLFVDPENPYLCTSPDGLIRSDGLLEIKCPYSAKNSKNLKEFCASNKKYGLTIHDDGSIHLPSTHKFYYQIQGQLNITNRQWCDLFLWCGDDTLTIRVKRDKHFWNNNLPKLKQFYFNLILTEILDPRVRRNMPFLKLKL
ncbi:yqaJ domain-containing protein [Trichonephila clavata]|uniref:YqaJ domain-containing protein n=1 Tax=Trichonephila clavata TaxID=2740835 RepID=A0A8X6LGT6_TRICU|nr:yqaJ domain-containing protein [Trichonephila clavata]